MVRTPLVNSDAIANENFRFNLLSIASARNPVLSRRLFSLAAAVLYFVRYNIWSSAKCKTMSKRKHVTLNLQQKAAIIRHIEAGENIRSIANKYGVGKSTISDINKNKEKILEFIASSDSGTGNRKTLKGSEYPEMEKALFAWYLQERARGMYRFIKLKTVLKKLYLFC